MRDENGRSALCARSNMALKTLSIGVNITRRKSSESGFEDGMPDPHAFYCLPVPLDAIAWNHRGCNVPVHKLDA